VPPDPTLLERQRPDRAEIRQMVLAGGNVPRANNVNFALRAGTTVPTRVQVVEVPSALIESIRAAGLGDEPKEDCTLPLEGPSISAS
jgi:hypothetical protein